MYKEVTAKFEVLPWCLKAQRNTMKNLSARHKGQTWNMYCLNTLNHNIWFQCEIFVLDGTEASASYSSHM
jgi:hypothetical protein